MLERLQEPRATRRACTPSRTLEAAALTALALIVGCACDPPPPELDSGPPMDAGAAPADCAMAEDCDDGLACNGAERCDDGACVGGEPLVCDDGLECTRDACVEARGGCVFVGPDADGDGHAPVECGGDDCDDTDPLRYVGNVEVCDASGRDEDCDPATFGSRDADGDGAVDARCCNGEVCGTDCDDMQPGAAPDQPEVCDGYDNDCDGHLDEGVEGTFYLDEDGDGFGPDVDPTTVTACHLPSGYSVRRGDCDDADALANPGLPEVCDGDARDDDCDGVANPTDRCSCVGDEARACQDGLGEPLGGACAAGVERCIDGAFATCTIRPVNEVCDGGADEDCDGSVDEGLTVACFPDFDNDGFAAAGSETLDVCPAEGRVSVGGCPGGTTDRDPSDEADCDDRSGAARPTAVERPLNEIDDDCDGTVDET